MQATQNQKPPTNKKPSFPIFYCSWKIKKKKKKKKTNLSSFLVICLLVVFVISLLQHEIVWFPLKTT